MAVALASALAHGAGAAAATAAPPCAPPAKPFAFRVTATKSNAGTELAIAISSRTAACAVPGVLRRVEVRARGERRARVYGRVRAPAGRAAIRLAKLSRHQRLKVTIVVPTGQVLRGQTRVLLLPDLSLKLVAPLSAARDTQFTVTAVVAEANGDLGARATLSVTVGPTAYPPQSVRVAAGGRRRIPYPATLAPEGTYPVTAAITAVSPGETLAANDQARTTVEVASFHLATGKVLVPSLEGYGAQFNQHVYAAISRGVGVTEDNVKDMEAKVVDLHPQFVRVFFHPGAYNDDDEMQSFVRSVQLAERAGATINVTWQGGGTDDPAGFMLKFARTLADLVTTRGVTRLRWVTVQNEVNSTRITMQAYEQFYRLLDADLRSLGVRDRVRFMGGDLVEATSPLGQTQQQWFAYLATRMADVLDAWSIHVFWDYTDTAKLVRRLTEVRQIWDALPPGGRKPLYVTEYSVRGLRTATGPPDPGAWADGTPIALTNVSAFQHAWFDVLAAKLGYHATSKWDAYFAKYDRGTQAYSMIGPPQEGWPVRPVYNVLRLFTSSTAPGWRIVTVEGSAGAELVSGYTGPSGRVTVIGLDTDGAQLNVASPIQVPYSIGGLPPNARLRLLVWNLDGGGTLAPDATAQSDANGVATVTIPLHAVFALTTA